MQSQSKKVKVKATTSTTITRTTSETMMSSNSTTTSTSSANKRQKQQQLQQQHVPFSWTIGLVFVFVWFFVTSYVIRLQTWMIFVVFGMILMSMLTALNEFTNPLESLKKRKESLSSFEEIMMEENRNGSPRHSSSNNNNNNSTKKKNGSFTTSTVHVAQGIEGQTTPLQRVEVKRQVEQELPTTATITSTVMDQKNQKQKEQKKSVEVVTNESQYQQQVIINSATSTTGTSVPVAIVSSLVRHVDSTTSMPVEVVVSTVVSEEQEEEEEEEEEVVLHCGTVIDLQGSHGYIMPHDLVADSSSHHIPLVVPFELEQTTTPTNDEASSIVIGKTVAFEMATSNSGINSAINVCPASSKVNLDEEILKTRHALLTCKLAREQSFAKAMNQLKKIAPRHEPVELQVDLIQYAKQLDEDPSSIEEEEEEEQQQQEQDTFIYI